MLRLSLARVRHRRQFASFLHRGTPSTSRASGLGHGLGHVASGSAATRGRGDARPPMPPANAARHFRRPRIAASGQGGIKIRVQDAVHLIKTYRKRRGLGIVSVGRQSRGRQRRSISRNYCKHLLMNAHEPPSIGSKSTRPQRAPRREAWASPGCHTTPTTGPQRVHCPQ